MTFAKYERQRGTSEMSQTHFPLHLFPLTEVLLVLLQLAMATVFFFFFFFSFEQNGAILNDNPFFGFFHNKSHYKVDKNFLQRK